jgi:hypothetical protein
MEPEKNITQKGRRPKFSTEEERRESILESKRNWARKNLSKNKDGDLYVVHKTSNEKMGESLKLEDLVENKLLKEKILAKDREIELLEAMILAKGKENNLLREIIDLLKTRKS